MNANRRDAAATGATAVGVAALACCRYRLRAAHTLNSRSAAMDREGAWLRVGFADGSVGHADLCPFPALGDRTLDEELQALALGAPLAVGRRSLALARLDAVARAQGRALLDPALRPRNHFLVADLEGFDSARIEALAQAGYRRFKLKLGRDLAREARLVDALARRVRAIGEANGFELRLRLDFNARPGRDAFVAWLDTVEAALLPVLDFVEDPFAYDARAWAAVAGERGIRLALDLAADPLATLADGAAVVVVKPAVQDPARIAAALAGTGKAIVFTHYMDSALGQMFALHAAQAALANRSDIAAVHGLQQQALFVADALADAVGADGAVVVPPAGVGIGFGDRLARLPWSDGIG